ncbi:MAG: cell envelope integrity protein TolA, partial [Phyllobacteriaceae bacterium]|nr:cell envelope integrity protein TolA [Phyllobacteriaceae bacterium]
AKAKAAADAKAEADAKAKAVADAKAKAEADAKVKAAADAKAKAEADAKAKAAAAAKAAADAKAAAAKAAAGNSKGFSSQISDVLNKNQTGSSQGKEQKTASLGSTTGKIGVTHMTQAETDGLIGQIKKCWNPPIGAAEAGLKVVLRFSLNADGSLSGQPELVQAPAHPLGTSLAASARRALMQCGPYKMPSDKYSAWQKVEATFDPKDL